MDSRGPLAKALFPTVEEREVNEYKSYFSHEMWTIKEFGALMVGLTPSRCSELLTFSSKGTQKESRQVREALKLSLKMTKTVLNNNDQNVYYVDGEVLMSLWRHIKWAALNGFPIRKRFFEACSLSLQEIYFEFQPDNVRAQSNRINLNKRIYQAAAQQILIKYPNINREDLYERLIPISSKFKDDKGNRKYEKRTLKERWLAEVHELKIGRPKKSSKRSK